MTDLNAEGETLPLNPPKEEWLGHKGMVQAAQYIFEKLAEEQLIERAKNHRPDRGTKDFEIVIVGHSLGKVIILLLLLLSGITNSSTQEGQFHLRTLIVPYLFQTCLI